MQAQTLPFEKTQIFHTEENCAIAELLNLSSEPNLSIALAKVEVGQTTKLHCLKNTEEKYVILSGRGEMEINGAIIGIVSRLDVVNIPANMSQRIKNIGNEELEFICVCTPRFEDKNYVNLEE